MNAARTPRLDQFFTGAFVIDQSPEIKVN